ncbi:hypothetical protein FHS57_003614 [Runella defluvii]|uniref:Uncharacterized protein n=1 Tax=Runella defluvii TaxID=370973 RepID=A0A7W5ZMU8_9BACT|nr:DUF6625 family protein [Runella defluvii]MBB3839605.1 hypothetical protein [Runella defluvii]
MKTILIILPYFGPFPKMFPFWLESAYANSSIDFLIITNNKLDAKKNIKVVNMEFEELKLVIQKKFDFPISLPSPYKLCDFKGAYGVIFCNFIKGYDFWGFGDIDLIYGNIRLFLTNEILSNFWVISGWGHLTLYKNNEMCNNFFKNYLEGFQYYKNVFSNPKNSAFDEYNHRGLSDMWKVLYPEKIWNCYPFDDIRVPRINFNFISEFHLECSYKLIFEYRNKNLRRIYVNSFGEAAQENILYVHFQQRGFMKILANDKESYLIVPNKFIDIEDITIQKLDKWTKPRDIERNIWYFLNRIKRRFKMILKNTN